MADVEVVDRDGEWFVDGDDEHVFPDRDSAVEAAVEKAQGGTVRVVVERSAHVVADIQMKGN